MNLKDKIKMRSRIAGFHSQISKAIQNEIVLGHYKLKDKVQKRFNDYFEPSVNKMKADGIDVLSFRTAISMGGLLIFALDSYGYISFDCDFLYSLYETEEDREALKRKLDILTVLVHIREKSYNYIDNYTQLIMEFPYFEKLIVNNKYKIKASEGRGFNRQVIDEVRDAIAKEFYTLTISKNFIYRINNRFEMVQSGFDEAKGE